MIFSIIQENKNCQKFFQTEEVAMIFPISCHNFFVIATKRFIYAWRLSPWFTSTDLIIFSISSRLNSKGCSLNRFRKLGLVRRTLSIFKGVHCLAKNLLSMFPFVLNFSFIKISGINDVFVVIKRLRIDQ